MEAESCLVPSLHHFHFWSQGLSLKLKLTDWLDWPKKDTRDPSASPTSARITGISWLFTWAQVHYPLSHLPGPVCPFFSTVQ